MARAKKARRRAREEFFDKAVANLEAMQQPAPNAKQAFARLKEALDERGVKATVVDEAAFMSADEYKMLRQMVDAKNAATTK